MLLMLAAPQLLSAQPATLSDLLDGMLARARSEAEAAKKAPDPPAPAPSTPVDSDPLGSIARYKRYFSETGRAGFEASVRRLAPHRSAFEAVFAAEGVPTELVWLGLVESGYQPMAMSPRSAAGVWQFIPDTAARFGLALHPVDERTDPLKSARAAAKYLRFLHGMFGDWKLALAGYNAGEQRVLDAMRRAGSRDFWRLSAMKLLPEETREYVPAVLAAQAVGTQPAVAVPDKTPKNVVYAAIGGLE